MALSTKLGKVCQSCGREGKYNTMYLCYQCNGYHCEDCSLLHNKDHLLIPLTTDTQTSTDHSTSKPATTSALESNVEGNVLYQREGEIVNSTSLEQDKSTVYTNPRPLKATKCLTFSVERPEDKKKVWLTGLLCLLDNVVVVDADNKVLKLFDQSGTYLSSTKLKDYTSGITYVGDGTFATCGGNTVCLWTIKNRQGIFTRGKRIVSEDVSYHVDHTTYGIHFNGTYYCVLHREDNAITILDRQGRQVRKIIMKEACGKKFEFGLDIHMDSDTNNIYVPCSHEHGVLCMTMDELALWFIRLHYLPRGITEIQGILCVADNVSASLHQITKEGEYVRKLLDEEDLGGNPYCVCYGQDDRLYVSYSVLGDCKNISVYTFKK
ncbi:hypothetical protein FSP39_003947 [Pinctada imbricata]|uniref:B box-type domain-containing protein n=1 Tax=Pinctada imbricata TaxID=66713 RepID=A0AA88YWV4_PINIB|nr:hypothetical protein FSP39_003947 [Pinctada imbricata]